MQEIAIAARARGIDKSTNRTINHKSNLGAVQLPDTVLRDQQGHIQIISIYSFCTVELCNLGT